MDLIYEWHHDIYVVFLFWIVILSYLTELEIPFLLPRIYNVRLDFFAGYFPEVLEASRWQRTQRGYIHGTLAGF